MSQNYVAKAEDVASGTDLTFLNLFNDQSTPNNRALVYDLLVGAGAAVGDNVCKVHVARTTAVGTEGGGFDPNNLDPDSTASSEYDAGVGAYSVEPTYTANKELLVMAVHQRGPGRWVARPGFEIVLPATQNAGCGVRSKASSSTQSYCVTILWME